MSANLRLVPVFVVTAALLAGGCGPIEEDGPADQQKFAVVVAEARTAYKDALDEDNPFKREKAMKRAKADRKDGLCDLFSDELTVEDWVGEVSDVQMPSEGGAGLDVVVATDGGSDPSLQSFSQPIPEKSKYFDVASNLEEGERIRFSGSFVKAKSTCINISNVTRTFEYDSPDFPFEFTKVELLD